MFRLTVSVVLFVGVVFSATAETPPVAGAPLGSVSREAPAIYAETLAPLLTPLKEVMAKRQDFATTGRDGVYLLDETVVHTDELGRRILVFHTVEEALTESGVEGLAAETVSYSTEEQRIHMVLARTILPDGKELPIEDGAAFLESPQADAGDSVYSDRAQLRMIFSGAKVGAVREVIVVVEDGSARIPGHFTAQEHWGAYWPERLARTVMVMPDSVANRVRVTALGSGVPVPAKERLQEGWQVWTWSKEKLPARRYEPGRPPFDQAGPAAFLTTLPDWDAFGGWYRQLLQERAVLTPALKKLAVAWTKEAKTPRDKVDAIITRVARDLRYTGLEFGMGALQPRTPEQVWKTGYGDCKDKANLAVLLLREAGVAANLVLLQTEHAGRIEKRCPDYRHFNHAILAAETDEGLLFCDPTIRYGKAGALSGSSSDRDVLIVKEGTVEWARTPPFSASEVRYHIDAAHDPGGGLEGWLEMICSGYFSASYRAYYERFGSDELRRDVQETLSAILPGARLIDAERCEPGKDAIWRCFFALPSHQDSANDERQTLHFPAGDAVMLSVGDDETRETPRFLWPLKWRVTGTISLPSGWSVVEKPAPFDLHTEAYDVRASWTIKDGACIPNFEATVTRNLLEPEAHRSVWRGTQSLRNWLRKPLWLARGGAAAFEAAEPTSLGQFPLMPTGAGQLALVEQRFPVSGNKAVRRAALKTTIDFFPDDPVTLFTARVRLALLDWNEDKAADGLRGLRGLTANPNPKVDEETVWWARYVTGLILTSSGNNEEALREFEAVTARPTVSAYRRSWACFHAATVLEKMEQHEKALETTLEGLALHELESTPSLLAHCASLLFQLKKQAELKEVVEGVVDAHETKAAPALAGLAALANEWAADGHAQWTSEIVALLEALPSHLHTSELTAALAQAKGSVATAGVAGALQQKLKTFLKKHPQDGALQPPADGWPATLELCSRAYAQAETDMDSDLAYRVALRIITAFPSDSEFGSHLWHTAAHLDNHERNQKAPAASPLLKLLFKLAKRLPKTDDSYFEMCFLEGRLHERRHQDWQKAASIYEEMIADSVMPESYRAAAVTRLADCRQELGDWASTVATLSTLESLKSYASAGDGLARAAHLRLELGEPDEALRLLGVVASSRDFALEHSAMQETLRTFLDMAKDEKAAKARWQVTPKWWPLWKEMQIALNIEDNDVEPLIVDLDTAGANIKQAVQDKDTATAGRLLRQVAHGARWHPGRVIDMAWLMVFQLPSLYPEHHQSLLALLQAVLDDFDPVADHQHRSRLMYLAISHMDRDDTQLALRHVHDYFSTYPADEHAITFVMARLWAANAMNVKDEQANAILALERTLASKELRAERAQSVHFLADLYRATGDTAKEISLLTAALTHPAIAPDSQRVDSFKQRLDQLTAGAGYAKAVQRWLSKHAPPWFDFVQPENLDALDGEDLHAAIEATSNQRTLMENLKVYLLAASNESLQPDQIDEWWARGYNLLLVFRALEETQMRTEVDTLLTDPEAPPALKDTTIRVTYFHAADHERKELLQYLRGTLPPAQFSAFSRDRMTVLDAVVAVDLNNPGEVTDLLRAQVKKRDASLLGIMTSKLTERAVRYGKLPVLEALADGLAQARKEGVADASALQAMRLDTLRALSTARRLLPVHEALAAVVLQDPMARPVKDGQAPDRIGSVSYPMMPSRQYLDWMHARLSSGCRPCDDLHPWYGYLEACSELSAEATWELRRKLIDAAAHAAADDETRAELVGLAASGSDIDSPAERSHLMQVLKPWREAATMPRAYAEIRLLEAHMAQRLGERSDLQQLDKLKADGFEERLAVIRLNAALCSGDAAVVGAALDKLGSDVMLQAGNLPSVIRALKLCARDVELELAMETAKEELYEAILMSWTGVDPSSVQHALVLASALDSPDALPEAWITFVHDAYPERHDQLTLTMRVAQMRKDWPAALAAATEAAEQFPTFYSNYWTQAQALWELGRIDEAIAPLRVYTKFCHDEAEHPRAMDLLKGAGG